MTSEIDYQTVELDLDNVSIDYTGDCFVCYCEYENGREISNKDYEKINEDSDLVYELVMEQYL